MPSFNFCKCQKLQQLPKDEWMDFWPLCFQHQDEILAAFCILISCSSVFGRQFSSEGQNRVHTLKFTMFPTTRNDIFQTPTPSPSVSRTMLQRTGPKLKGALIRVPKHLRDIKSKTHLSILLFRYSWNVLKTTYILNNNVLKPNEVC